jgi:hypothetical protein
MSRYVAAMVALLVVGSLAVGADDGVLLRNKFTPGETVTYIMDIDADTSMTIRNRAQDQEQSMDMTMQMAMDVTMDTLSVDDEGVGEVRVKYGKMDMDMQIGAQAMQMEIDLANGIVTMGENTRELPGDMVKLLGEGIVMKMTPQGKVVEIKGGEAFEKLMSEMGAQGFNMNLKQMMEQNQVQFPDGPVKVGDTWTQTTKLPAPMAKEVSTKYTLTGFEHVDNRQCAKLATELTMQGELGGEGMPMPNPTGMQVTMNDMNIDATGTVWFDYEAGTMAKMELEMSMSMNMHTKGTVKLPDGKTQEVDVETDIEHMDMNMTMTLAD